MSDLGRLFSYVILVLSIFFFVIAAVVNGTHRETATRVSELERENDALERSIREEKATSERVRTQLAQEQAARVAALAALQQQVNTIEGQLSTAESNYREEQSRATQLSQTLDQTQAELKRVTAENENIRAQISETLQDRNQLRTRLIQQTDELYNVQSLLADARGRVKSLQEEVTLLQARNNAASATLAAAGLSPDPEDTPPADLQGKILATDGGRNVEISLGRDDGLRVGHQLEVFRGNQYLGRIRVTRVSDDKALGEILQNFRNGFIQANDTVAASVN